MQHSKAIENNELPSTLSLIKATLVALTTSLIILVCIVLPAEFGIDITGTGQVLGLQKMGEIKVSLAEEASSLNSEPEQISITSQSIEPQAKKHIKEVIQANEEETPTISNLNTDKRTIVIKEGEAAELKVALNKGEFVNFEWQTNEKVNFDNHGDSAKTSYYPYSKGKRVTRDQGTIIAAFDGFHGWFWRNRSGKSVTLEIAFEGQYSQVKRVK